MKPTNRPTIYFDLVTAQQSAANRAPLGVVKAGGTKNDGVELRFTDCLTGEINLSIPGMVACTPVKKI